MTPQVLVLLSWAARNRPGTKPGLGAGTLTRPFAGVLKMQYLLRDMC